MMQIRVEFESLSEMKAFARELIGCECAPKEEPKKALTAEELTESAKVTEEIINRAEAREAEEKKAPAPKKEAPAPEPAPAPASAVTETQITTLLAKKIKEGKKAEVKDLFTKYGVTKKSELLEKHPDKFDEIYAAVEAL